MLTSGVFDENLQKTSSLVGSTVHAEVTRATGAAVKGTFWRNFTHLHDFQHGSDDFWSTVEWKKGEVD